MGSVAMETDSSFADIAGVMMSVMAMENSITGDTIHWLSTFH